MIDKFNFGYKLRTDRSCILYKIPRKDLKIKNYYKPYSSRRNLSKSVKRKETTHIEKKPISVKLGAGNEIKPRQENKVKSFQEDSPLNEIVYIKKKKKHKDPIYKLRQKAKKIHLKKHPVKANKKKSLTEKQMLKIAIDSIKKRL